MPISEKRKTKSFKHLPLIRKIKVPKSNRKERKKLTSEDEDIKNKNVTEKNQ